MNCVPNNFHIQPTNRKTNFSSKNHFRKKKEIKIFVSRNLVFWALNVCFPNQLHVEFIDSIYFDGRNLVVIVFFMKMTVDIPSRCKFASFSFLWVGKVKKCFRMFAVLCRK